MANNTYHSPLYGWWLAVLHIFLFLGLGYNCQRFVAVNTAVDPLVFGAASFIGAAFVLLTFSGPGELTRGTITSPHTWVFGLFLILTDVLNTFIFQHITSTEATFLHRITLVIGFLIGWFFLNRRLGYDRIISAAVIIIGVSLIIFNVDPEKRALIYSSIAIFAVLSAIRIYIAELHPDNLRETTFLSKCRMAGVVTAVTSLLLLVTALLIAHIQSYSAAPIEFLPEYRDFGNRWGIYGAIILGMIFAAPIRYLEFTSVRLIKAENLFAMASFLPIAVLTWETLFATFGLFEIRTLTAVDLVAGVLITAAAAFTVYVRIRRELGGHFDLLEYAVKVSEAAQRAADVQIADEDARRRRFDDLAESVIESHEIIADTMERYDHFAPKVADLLGIPEKLVEAIAADSAGELTLEADDLRRVTMNYRHNVVTADPLTGLKNRAYFVNQVSRAGILHPLFTAFFIDLNGFKPVNDTYGHAVGDKLLQSVGNRLNGYVDSADIAARLGGDEFGILIYGIDADAAQLVANELRQKLAEPYDFNEVDGQIRISASIGYAVYPDDANNTPDLLECADRRMYQEKQGKGR